MHSGGLRTLEDASRRYALDKYGFKSVGVLCLRRDPERAFPQEQCATRRRELRTCHDLHPGLCRSADKEVYQDAKRLGKNIYDVVAALAVKNGECLLKIGGSSVVKFWWLMRRVLKPQRLYFCEAVQGLVNGQQVVDMKRPLVRASNFAIALELLSLRRGDEQFTLQVVQNRSDEGPLWRVVEVSEGEPLTLSYAKRVKAVEEVDPLEAALDLACKLPPKRRRISKKQQVESSSDPDVSDESVSSDERLVVDPLPDKAVAAAPAAPAGRQASFFHEELGIV